MNCQIVNILYDLKEQSQGSKEVCCYVFKRAKTSYCNKSGKKASCTCTAFVDKCELLETIIKKLQAMNKSYLSHYFLIINDKVHWDRFWWKKQQQNTLYSQSIALKGKRQVQSAHFSGKQHTIQ